MTPKRPDGAWARKAVTVPTAPFRADAPVTTAQVPTAVPFADPRTLALLGLMLFGFGLAAARRAHRA